MARPLRIEFAGAIYHVIARGNARAPIFIDDHDRRLFLFELARVAARRNWWLWAYCLMGNHFHLVLETAQPTLARGMRDVNGNYSQAFNRRHDRVGHLFQGRYRSILLDKEGYLPQVIRYVLMNPVRAGLVDRPDDWYWSSFLATAGTADVPPRLAVQRVLALFDPDPNRARRTFTGLFSTDSPAIEWPTPVRDRAAVGSAEFVDGLGTRVQSASPEVPRLDRTWKALACFENEAPTRDDAIRAAYASGAYTLHAIAEYFGLHYTTVSQIVHRHRKLAIQDLTP